MVDVITTQELIDAKRDARDLGKAVNEKVIVSPRYGEDFKSLPMISEEAQSTISEWRDAINTISNEDGVPALTVSTANGENQQDINDYSGAKWRNKAGGYDLNARVMLDNGDIVKSTVAGNNTNPNVDMIGWVNPEAEQKSENKKLAVADSILNYTADAELASAFESALLGSSSIVLNKRDGGYTVSSFKSIELQHDIVIDFNNQPINFTGNIQLKSPVILATTIAAPITRYATQINLTSASGVQAGDLMYLLTNVIAETQWNYKKQDCVRIKSVSGDTIELEEPIQFSYAVADAGLSVTIYRPKKAVFINPVFNLNAVTGTGMFDLIGLVDIEIHNPKAVGSPSGWDASTNELRRMFRIKNCFNAVINNAEFTRLSYPILQSDGTRNVTVNTVKITDCRHSIEVTSWAKGLTVNNLSGSDNYASISAHPAFDVVYDGVSVERDRMPPNLRCVRGELRNIKMHTLADDTIISGSYFQSLLLPAETSYLWNDADLYFDGVKINAPNRTKASLGAYYGRNVYVSNCRDKDFNTAVLNGLSGQIFFGSGNSFNGKQSPSTGISSLRAPARLSDNPLVNAELKSGIYDLDLRANVVDQLSGYIKCYGSVVRELAGDQGITLRIHDNCFAGVDNINQVRFGLKLKAGLRHSNAGAYAYQEKWYNFYHKASTASGVVAPLDALWTSLTQGVTNESLEMSVTGVSQVGRTEVGANGDFYIDVSISLTSGRSSPVYALAYELELQMI